MKYFKTLESWILSEENKTVAYFRNNPGALKREFGNIPMHKNGETDLFRGKSFSGNNATTAARKKSYDLLLKLNDGNDIILKTKRDQELSLLQWFSGYQPPGQGRGWISADEGDKFKKFIIDNDNPQKLMDALKKDYFRIDYDTSPFEIGDFWKFISTNYRNIKKISTDAYNAIVGTRAQERKHETKELLKLGINQDDLTTAMSWIEEWTSMSRKRLPPEVWPLLQSISVDSSSLPEYIYRGLFFDGAKIKDLPKFLSKWHAGSKPGASQGKATSWSYDRKTAASFMIDQDFIKDKKGGFYVLLKWKVDPKLVICDLRNLPVDHKFWNQQEFIVSPEAKDYEVDTIISGSDEIAYKQFTSDMKGGENAFGRNKKEFMSNIMFKPYDSLDLNQKIDWKRLMYMTVDEAEREFGQMFNWIPEIRSKIGSVLFPLAKFIDNRYTSGFIMRIHDVESPSKLKLEFIIRLDDLSNNRSHSEKTAAEEYKRLYDNPETKFNPFSVTKDLVGYGYVSISEHGYYNIDILMEFPTDMKLEQNPKEDPTREQAIKADNAFMQIIDLVGVPALIANMQLSLKDDYMNRLSQNIQVTLK